jgi:hypothetical protein
MVADQALHSVTALRACEISVFTNVSLLGL